MDDEQWNKSLIFPTLVSFIAVLTFRFDGIDAPLVIMGVLCGVIPLLLTIIFKVDTSDVVSHKLKYSLICLGGLLVAQAGTNFNLFVISGLFILDFLYLNGLPLLNRLVAALSNPTFVLLIFMAELMEDLSAPFNLGFG